jgi:hypothetical protein
MAKPTAGAVEAYPMVRLAPAPLRDPRLPVRLSLGRWAGGAGRSAFVGLCATPSEPAVPIAPTLGAHCLADADGELVLALDPGDVTRCLTTHPGAWYLVASLSPYERTLAGTAWSPRRVVVDDSPSTPRP